MEYQKMNNEELCDIIKNKKEGRDEALEALMNNNEAFIWSIVKKMPKSDRFTAEDLFQSGSVGMMEAAERYEKGHGANFLTYATFYIEKEIKALIDKNITTVYIPKAAKKKMRDEGKELPKESSLNAMCFDDGAVEQLDQIADEQAERFYESVEVENTVFIVRRAISLTLSEKERDVISRRSGMYDGHIWTLEEIGKAYGVTKERIRQIENTAKRKLRNRTDLQELQIA